LVRPREEKLAVKMLDGGERDILHVHEEEKNKGGRGLVLPVIGMSKERPSRYLHEERDFFPIKGVKKWRALLASQRWGEGRPIELIPILKREKRTPSFGGVAQRKKGERGKRPGKFWPHS